MSARSLLLAALAILAVPGEGAAQQNLTGLWKDATWKDCVGITQEPDGAVKMKVRPDAAFTVEGKLSGASLAMTHALSADDVKTEDMLTYDDANDKADADTDALKGKPVFPADKPGAVSADGETITLTQTKWTARKAKGDKAPTVSSNDVVLSLKRCLSVKIHLPRAQDPAAPLAADKRGRGVVTLANDGIDLEQGAFPAARMDAPKGRPATAPAMTPVEAFDLADLDARVQVDSRVPGAGARNLVRIDLAKAAELADGTVFLNVYPMVSVEGTAAHPHPTASALAPELPKPAPTPTPAPGAAAAPRTLPAEPETAIRLWREETQATRVALPYAMKGEAETLYIEGLKPGRYRLVLLFAKGGATTAANLKANEPKPDETPTPGRLKLLSGTAEYEFPPDHARLTVAKLDIFQEKARSHLFDVLWNGHAVVQGHLWPAGGTYQFGQQAGALPAHWMNVGNGGAFAALPAPPTQTAAVSGEQAVALVKGGFVVERGVAGGGAVAGSGLYDARLSLTYDVEGVHLVRRAPLTILAPTAVHVADWGGLTRNDRGTYVGDGDDVHIWFRITYRLLDQNGRRIRLLQDDAAKRTYGAKLRMWESLGGASRGNQQLTVRRVVKGVPEIFWTYIDANGSEKLLGTAPRERAAPFDANDEFHDNFGTTLDMGTGGIRNFYDIEMQNRRLQDGDTVLEVAQDVVCTVDNGDATDDPGTPRAPGLRGVADVRVGRNNRLTVIAPRAEPGGRRGHISFAMFPGVLDANRPTMVARDHTP